MGDTEKILQDSGIIIQPYWRKLYNHSAATLRGMRMHPTQAHEYAAAWIEQS